MKKNKPTALERRRKLQELIRALKPPKIARAARQLDESIKAFRRGHEITRETLDMEISV